VKPTYGRVSRYGLVAFASSLDQVGPFATTVADAALLLDVIAGHDPLDSTSIDDDHAPVSPQLAAGVAGLRIGLVEELTDVDGVQAPVRDAVAQAGAALEAAGATVERVSIPSAQYALSAYYLIAPAEASSNLARYDGVRYGLRVDADHAAAMNAETREAGFGPEVKRRIMLGTYALSAGYYDAYYRKAQTGTNARDPRLRSGLRALRRAPGTHVADGGVPPRGQDRQPARDVPLGRLHDPEQPGRARRDERAVRCRRRAACPSESRSWPPRSANP